MKRLRITVEGKAYDVTVEVLDEVAPSVPVPVKNPAEVPPPVLTGPDSGDDGVPIISQLAGSVVGVSVSVGQTIIEGQALVVLEAMKMNTTVVAPNGGTVKSIAVETGMSVEEGQTLLTLSS